MKVIIGECQAGVLLTGQDTLVRQRLEKRRMRSHVPAEFRTPPIKQLKEGENLTGKPHVGHV